MGGAGGRGAGLRAAEALILWLIACSLPVDTDVDEPITVADLWEGVPDDEITVEAIVTSPRTADGTAFYAADPITGDAVRIALNGALTTLPPPIRALVTITGDLRSGEVPEIGILDLDDVAVIGVAEPVVFEAEDARMGALARMADITVGSSPDPLDRADTSGPLDFGGTFGAALPGWGCRGDAVGIVTSEGRLSPRSAADWSGPTAGEPPLSAMISTIRDLADGTPVTLDGVQATPWSPGDRWMVVQDSAGQGLWVDAEGFLAAPESTVGDVVRLAGEVRSDSEGTFLRTWASPEEVGSAAILVGDTLEDGAIVGLTVTVTGVEGGLVTTAERVSLGSRFVDATALTGTLAIQGPVRGDVVHPL